jgi:hypothetical protein
MKPKKFLIQQNCVLSIFAKVLFHRLVSDKSNRVNFCCYLCYQIVACGKESCKYTIFSNFSCESLYSLGNV